MDLNNKFGWQDIEGWFGYSQMYDQIIRETNKNDTIVEIGKWLGKSSCYLASRAKMSGKKVKIICVDTFSEKLIGPKSCSLNKNTLVEFNENMTKAGVVDYITTMAMTPDIASYNVKNESIFAVFIEGDDIKNIIDWYPKIKPGGIIAGSGLSIQKSIKKTIEIDIKEDKNGVWFARKPQSKRLD